MSYVTWSVVTTVSNIYMYHYYNVAKLYYENLAMQHTAIFHGSKNDNFHLNFFIYYFRIFAQNIDRGYTLEPPQ